MKCVAYKNDITITTTKKHRHTKINGTFEDNIDLEKEKGKKKIMLLRP